MLINQHFIASHMKYTTLTMLNNTELVENLKKENIKL